MQLSWLKPRSQGFLTPTPIFEDRAQQIKLDQRLLKSEGGYQCSSGVINENSQDLQQLGVLVSPNKFIIPVTNPAQEIEPGDILVYYKNPDAGALELILNGMTHVAIAYKDAQQRIQILESPKNYSKTQLSGVTYHILRLRRYPPELDSDPSFKGVARNSLEKMLIGGWNYKRRRSLEKINELIEKLKDTDFKFNSKLKVEALDEKQLPMLDALIRSKDGENLEFYCSDLVYTIYRLAGFSVAEPRDSMEALSFIDKKVFPVFHLKFPKSSDHQVREEIFFDLMSKRQREILGIDEETAQRLRVKFVTLLDAKPEDRVKMLGKDTEGIQFINFISPSDIFRSIYRPYADLQYVGTKVNENCKPLR